MTEWNVYVGAILLTVMIVCFLIFCLWAFSGDYKWSVPATRYRRYYRSYNENLQQKVKAVFMTASDEEFETFCKSIEKRINYKYSVKSSQIYHTRMKRAVLDIINRNTHKIKEERVRKVEKFFPLLHRVYFGPKLTKEIYSEEFKTRKFHFRMREVEKIPEIRNMIDLALYFQTSVSMLLGYCYTQTPNNKTYFIKSKKPRRKEYKSRHYKRYFLSKRSSDATPLIKSKGESPQPEIERSQLEIGRPSETRPTYKKNQKQGIPWNQRKRLISVPRYQLKMIQKKILHEILEKAEIKPYCTGFRPEGSTVKNAKPHLGTKTLVKMDLMSFFPSLKIKHVFQVFRGFGYCRPVAGVLACLCTDFFYSKRFMPQGAPTSPMIGNLYGSILDARLHALWKRGNFNYTRYADDLTFSSKNPDARVDGMIETTYKIIKGEELFPNYKKTKIFRAKHSKEVTGIMVNEILNINRTWVKIFRAQLHKYLLDGLPSGEEGLYIAQQLQGKISYLFMVNPQKAEKYLPQLKQITQKFANSGNI